MKWWPAGAVLVWVGLVGWLLLTYRYAPIVTIHIATVRGMEVRATGIPSLPMEGVMENAQIVFWDADRRVAVRIVKLGWVDFGTGMARDIEVIDYRDGKGIGFMKGDEGMLINGNVTLRGGARLWRK